MFFISSIDAQARLGELIHVNFIFKIVNEVTL